MSIAALPPHQPCELPQLFAVDATTGRALPFAASPLAAAAFVDTVLHLRAGLAAPSSSSASSAPAVAPAAALGAPALLRARLKEELQAAQAELSLLRNALTFSRGSRWVGQHAERDNIFALVRVAAPAPPEEAQRSVRAACLAARGEALGAAGAFLRGPALLGARAQAAAGRFGATLLRACAAAGWRVLSGPAAAAAAAASALAHAPHLAHYALSPAHAHLLCLPQGYARAGLPPTLRSLAPLLILPPSSSSEGEAAGAAAAAAAAAAAPMVRLQPPLRHAACRLVVQASLGGHTAVAHAACSAEAAAASSSSSADPLAGCATEGERAAVQAVLADAALFSRMLALELGFAALLVQGAALRRQQQSGRLEATGGAGPAPALAPAAASTAAAQQGPAPGQQQQQQQQQQRKRRRPGAGNGKGAEAEEEAGVAGQAAAADAAAATGGGSGGSSSSLLWAVVALTHECLALETRDSQGRAVELSFRLLQGSAPADAAVVEAGGSGDAAAAAAAAAAEASAALLSLAVSQGPLREGLLESLLDSVAQLA